MKSNLIQEITKHLNAQAPNKTILDCLERVESGELTIDENLESHFCIYFAAYDPEARSVFLGSHKKSGLWLFNGGHIDEGESLADTLKREIYEEWGLNSSDFAIKDPALFTITKIDNPTKQKCLVHYDVWHFIETYKNSFLPNNVSLLEEFSEAGWKSIGRARELVTEENTLLALDFIEENLF